MNRKNKIFLLAFLIFILALLNTTAFCHTKASTASTDQCKYYKCTDDDGYYYWGNEWHTTKPSHTGGTATCLKKKVCTRCGNEYGSTLSHSYTGAVITDDETHHKYKCVNGCSNYGNRTECTFNTDPKYVDDYEHDYKCSECSNRGGKAKHSFDPNEVKWHKCTICNTYMKKEQFKHGFGEDGKCVGCSATLQIKEIDNWVENGEHWTNYRVFDSTPAWTETPLTQDTMKIELNHPLFGDMAYGSTKTIPAYLVVEGETYNRNDGEATIDLANNADYQEVKNNVLSLNDGTFGGFIQTIVAILGQNSMQDYNNLPDILTGTLGTNPAILAAWEKLNDIKEFKFEHSVDTPFASTTGTVYGFMELQGRIRIQTVTLKSGSKVEWDSHIYSDGGRLFTHNAPPPPPPPKYYGYLTVGYRNVENGEKIIGAPTDISRSGLIYHGSGGYHTASFSGKVDLDTMDYYGWRYVGYKLEKNTGSLGGAIPKEQRSQLNKSESYSTTCQMKTGEIFKSITFYFEPVRITIKHVNKNRTEIPTNKSGVTYELAKGYNSGGHVCGTLACETETITNQKNYFTPGTTYVLHNNTSLNKYLWPGYILTDYKFTSNEDGRVMTYDDGSIEASRTYDTNTTASPSNYDGITTHAMTGSEMAKAGVLTVPVEVYRKNIALKADGNVTEGGTSHVLDHKKGYMPDLTLTFNYENVDVKVEHRTWEDKTVLKAKTGEDLAYTQLLNGHYFELPSLFTTDDHVLSVNGSSLPPEGLPYNITGRIIKRLDLYKGNSTSPIWKKDFSYEQKEGSSLEAISADNLLYYVLTSNDIKEPEIINEINRIGNDIRFVYYYEKTPILTIKHVDEAGLKLWPDEHLLIAESGVNAFSKDLTKHNYKYKEYTLDTVLGHEEVTSPTNNNIVYVHVPRNGLNDRTLIYVYKEDYPILKVRYVDETGKDITDPLPDIKMTRDSHDVSALDLTGIKDENGNGYEYLRYELYKDLSTSNLDITENKVVNVEVKRNGQSRLLLFVYKGSFEKPEQFDVTEITSETVLLRSNERDTTEEYNVLRAVPTSEDLYANVITDSFLLSNTITQEEKKAKIKVKLVQPYYKRNDADASSTDIANNTDKAYTIESSNYIELDMPYSYIGAKNVQLDLISRSVVKNEAIEHRNDNGAVLEKGQVTLYPEYKKKPYLDYAPGGKLLFEDLADSDHYNLGGKTVSEYVKGLADGEYKLSTGFYNVKVTTLPNNEFEYEVEYILPEIQYTEVTRSMMDSIELKYKASPSLMTDACEKNNVRVNMDRLYVNDASINPDGSWRNVMILSGLDLPINREYTAIQLDKMLYGRAPTPSAYMADLHPKAALIDKDVLYKHTEIYISKDKINTDYNTKADVYYIAYQRVNPDTRTIEEANDHQLFITAGTYELTDPEAWRTNKEILVNAKRDIVGNKLFVHTPVVNDTMIVQSNNVIDHINKIFAGGSTTQVSNNYKNEFVAYAYKDLYNKAEDIDVRLKNGLKTVEGMNNAVVKKVETIEQSNADNTKTSKKDQSWNGGVTAVTDKVNTTTNDVKVTLLLGSTFDLFIPHTGTHLDETGYGRNTYNYDGLNANGDGFNKAGRTDENYKETFAWKKQVKFSFDVVDGEGNFIKKDEWHDLNIADEVYKFRILESNMELWQDKKVHTIDTRLIAENAKGTKVPTTDPNAKNDYPDISETFANLSRDNYIAKNHFDVKIIGDIRDLEARATTDMDWAEIQGSVTDSQESQDKLPIGQFSQNKNRSYVNAIKLGDAVYFDIATNGWYGDTSDYISITPKYYFISSNGGTAKEVDVYYKQSQSGPYVNILTTPYKFNTVMASDVMKGSEFKSTILFNKLLRFNNNANSELILTDSIRRNVVSEYYKKWVNTYRGGVFNTSERIDLGDTTLIKLPYNTRLAYSSNVERLLGTGEDSKYKMNSAEITAAKANVTGFEYSVGHWYGAFELPSSTIVVDKGVVPNPNASNKLGDGYIIVGFTKIITNSNGKNYLRYEPTKLEFQLPNGKTGKLPPNPDVPTGTTPVPGSDPDDPSPSIPVVIYELIPNTIKFGPTMTH